MITSFHSVFRHKLDKLKAKLKLLLSDKNKRHRKHEIKSLLQEAKELRNILKNAPNEIHECPNCGYTF